MHQPSDPLPPLPDDDHDYDDADRGGRGRGRLVVAGVGSVVALALLAGGAALALRDGGSDPGPDPDPGAGASTQEEALLDFARCMRDQGLDDFPDPVVEADGGVSFEDYDQQRESPGFAAADEACQPILREAGPPPPPEGQPPLTPDELADREDRWLGVARCVRAEGYDYPDPDLDEFGNTAAVQTDDPGFAEAIATCLAANDLDDLDDQGG